ncbi:5216_t:CDS:2 [Funneliformis geosporum]|uniref:5216_t:CDS:1 n=1 Tax=Funneliformis geosporum TaxID=1117311 RepID=A0A9W4SVJ6_9GLOM|nr:5216_t:CDS:2 [Funneliformis geosporum]
MSKHQQGSNHHMRSYHLESHEIHKSEEAFFLKPVMRIDILIGINPLATY